MRHGLARRATGRASGNKETREGPKANEKPTQVCNPGGNNSSLIRDVTSERERRMGLWK